uniref:TsaA-like domain-containing protein n=1 Tax=Peronospora matthiolae TaxID=2874970 RepID=A0AAV1VLC0_9STRA
MSFGFRLETVALALQTTTLLWLWWRQQQPLQPPRATDQRKKIQQLESEVIKKERARVDERRGRVAAEKELRRVMEEKLDTSKGCFVQPVGTVHSCFKVCLGTPRQGSLAPSTRAKITFHRSVSPDTLVGLEEFSHVWILFVFHQNTNGKNARAHEGLRSDSHRHTFRAKISPPMLKERVGIFCTRSPHRPNPIGITLAQIEYVDIRKRTVHLTGVDLLDETPVLDIKPYISAYDSLPDARAAGWVSTPQPSIKTEWDSSALKSTIYKLSEKSVHYRNAPEEFVAAIEEVLQVDVRSKFQTRRWTSPDYINYQVIDNVRVQYRFALSTALSPSPANDDRRAETAHIQIFAAEEAFSAK